MSVISDRAEKLEDRLVLISGFSAIIPDQINPALAEQAIFAPQAGSQSIAASVFGPASRLYKFTVDGIAFDNPIRFDLTPATSGSGADAALVLFDENGNVFVKVDADSGVPELGVETLEAILSVGHGRSRAIAGRFVAMRYGDVCHLVRAIHSSASGR